MSLETTETKFIFHEVSEKRRLKGAGDDVYVEHGTVINASGHVQEVDRLFNLLAFASMGITTGSMWPALGVSILVALYNGGPTGVIFEL